MSRVVDLGRRCRRLGYYPAVMMARGVEYTSWFQSNYSYSEGMNRTQ